MRCIIYLSAVAISLVAASPASAWHKKRGYTTVSSYSATYYGSPTYYGAPGYYAAPGYYGAPNYYAAPGCTAPGYGAPGYYGAPSYYAGASYGAPAYTTMPVSWWDLIRGRVIGGVIGGGGGGGGGNNAQALQSINTSLTTMSATLKEISKKLTDIESTVKKLKGTGVPPPGGGGDTSVLEETSTEGGKVSDLRARALWWKDRLKKTQPEASSEQ